MLRAAGMLCLLLWPCLGLAQFPPVYEAGFAPRDARWRLRPGDEAQLQDSAALLLMQHRNPGSSALLLREQYLRPGWDFEITASIECPAVGVQPVYGLCWSSEEQGRSYLAWLIRPEGYFAVVRYERGQETFLVPWTASRKLRSSGKPLLLALRKKGWLLYLYANGRQLASLALPRPMGMHHGVLIRNQAQLRLHSYGIYQPSDPIPLVTGPELTAVRRRLDSALNTPHFHETAPLLAESGRELWFSRSEADPLRSGKLLRARVQGDSIWGKPDTLLLPGLAQSPMPVALLRGGRLLAGQRYGPGVPAVPDPLAVCTFPDSGLRGAVRPEQIENLEGAAQIGSWQVSEDGQFLMFSADLPGGSGDLDLYVSFREGRRWSRPRNLGPDVNTCAKELSAWLAPDNVTLYISSNGHPGYGAGDVLVTERLSDTWTSWAQPLNLGPVINTPGWDAWYTPLPARPDQAYLASQDSLGGNWDLYSVRLPEVPARRAVVLVRGQVRSTAGGGPSGGKVYFRELASGQVASTVLADSASGEYRAIIPRGKAYQMYVERDGYYSPTDTLDVRTLSRYREIEKPLSVTPLEAGATIRLECVYFERASPQMLPDSYPELNRLEALMRALPGLEIEVRGHTDSLGQASELQRLSEARAAAVRQYLVSQGIGGARIRARGFGASQPVASNAHPDTRRLNRRVEFFILRR